MKPENILIDFDGYIKLTDFGLSKTNITKMQRSFSCCGSFEYLSPEMLNRGNVYEEGHGMMVDYFGLGVLLYEMIVGIPPFYDTNKIKMF